MPQSLISKAVSYAIGRWRCIYRYIDNGTFAIDNNIIVREIRPFVTDRKAWSISDSVPGADASAGIYSFMLNYRASDVEPYIWLRHVLTEMPKRQASDNVSDRLSFNYANR